MILSNKRDREAWSREKTIESLKSNTFLQENDLVLVAETNCFYKIVTEETDIPLKNNLYAKAQSSEVIGNSSTSDKLKTPRNIALSGDVTGNADFDGSKNIDISTTVVNDSHTHSNSTITSVDASKVNSGVLNVERIPNLDADKITTGTLNADRLPVLPTSKIPNLDASKITSGTIDIDRLPKSVLERCVIVQNDEERFALTKEQIQNGDAVKVISPDNIMYAVIDDTKLNQEAGYTQYSAAVKWETIKDKPVEFTPKTHSHKTLTIRNGVNNVVYDGSESREIVIQAGGGVPDYHQHNASDIKEDTTHRFVSDAEKDSWNNKANSNHTHTKSQINDFPTSLKNPNSLIIKLNGTSQGTYDGSSAKEINITAENVGAQPKGNYAPASHTHLATQITQDANNRFTSDAEKIKWNGKADANHKHDFDDFNVEFVNNDAELDLISGENYYKNKEEYTMLVEENECFSVKSMNDINNSLENHIPISKTISDDMLETILRIPNDNNSFVYQNQNYIFGDKIKKLRNMSNVKDVFAGCHCTYVLTYDNELFSFGFGTHGQLGDGDNIDDKIMHKVQIPKKPIKQVSIEHGRNCMILYEDNEIWVFGRNNNGCLGVGHTSVIKTPIKLNLSFNSNIKQISTKGIDNSYSISAILLESGELYVCGSGIHYATGLSHTNDVYSFVKNTFKFDSKPVKIVINSMYNHVNLFVVTTSGSIYSTGYRGAGSTMTGENPSDGIAGFTKATLIPEGEKVIDLFCSCNNYIIITDKSTYFYGYNASSSLGFGHSNTIYTNFIKTDFFSNKKIINFNTNAEWDGRGNHYLSSAILTDEGEVYCSGTSTNNLNTIDNPNSIEYFRKININNKKIISCKTGGKLRIFLTDDGEIYIIGESDDKEAFLIPNNTGYIHLLNYDFNNEDMYVGKPYIKREYLDESRCVEIYREEI